MSALSLRKLRKVYGDVVAVDGIDLEIAAGECFGLLGPNGAGKTTTIEICEGLTEPDGGDIEVLGRRWAGDERELRERLGIQLQDTQLSEKITVRETLDLFRSFYAQARGVDEVIAMVQLEEKRDARVGTLSGGQKQPARSWATPSSSSSTSRPRDSIRRRAASCGSCSTASAAPGARSSSPRTTWTRRSASATASRSWIMAR